MRRGFLLLCICSVIHASIVSAENNSSFVEEQGMSETLNELPDSIKYIIQSASHIEATCFTTNLEEEPTVFKRYELIAKKRKNLKKSICASDLHIFEAVPFGLFQPKVQYEFLSKKGTCTIMVDFSLKILRLKTKNSELQFILNDNSILKESIHLFPEDYFLSQYLKTSTQ